MSKKHLGDPKVSADSESELRNVRTHVFASYKTKLQNHGKSEFLAQDQNSAQSMDPRHSPISPADSYNGIHQLNIFYLPFCYCHYHDTFGRFGLWFKIMQTRHVNDLLVVIRFVVPTRYRLWSSKLATSHEQINFQYLRHSVCH